MIDEIKKLRSAGRDTAGVAKVLSAITASQITPQGAELYFLESELWQATPTGYTGKLQVAYDHPTLPSATKKMLDRLWATVFVALGTGLDTTISVRPKNPDIARNNQPSIALLRGMNKLVTLGHVTQADVDGFYDLGDGLKYPTTADVDVTDAEAIQAAADVAEAAQMRLINATGLFTERMTASGDANAIWAQAWIDSETP